MKKIKTNDPKTNQCLLSKLYVERSTIEQRTGGLLLLNKKIKFLPAVIIYRYKNLHMFLTVWAGKCDENEAKPIAKLAFYRGKSYNPTITPRKTLVLKAQDELRDYNTLWLFHVPIPGIC